MKILVPIKRVIDYNVKPRIKADGSAVDLANVKMSINPFCEIAVEQAIRLKEAGVATDVVVVSIGTSASQEQLRAALALGADRAVLIETQDTLEPLAIAKTLHKLVAEEQPGLVILGKQSIDSDNNQTGQMLAALSGMPQGTFASAVTVEDNAVWVTREVDSGTQTLKLSLPAVITTDLRLNEPRYPSLPNIMKAKRKPLDVRPLVDLGINTTPSQSVLSVSYPQQRQAGERVDSVDTLVDKLINEAKVI